MKVVVWTISLVLCTPFVFGGRIQFLPVDEKMSWANALDHCLTLGRMLAEPRSQILNDEISMRARTQVVISENTEWNRVWTAVNRIGQSATDDFLWGHLNNTFDYRNFDEANNAKMDGDCVEIYLRNVNTFGTNWATDDCNAKKLFFCAM